VTLLIVLSSIAAYLAAGGAYGRRWLAHERHATWEIGSSPSPKYDGDDRSVLAALAAVVALFWPFHSTFVVLAGWLWKPSDRADERADRLKADLANWRKREADAATDDERRMATDIADTLQDLLRGRA
jgi:hypothetical protein